MRKKSKEKYKPREGLQRDIVPSPDAEDMNFVKKLHSAGIVGEAFRKLCKNGCDPDTLEASLRVLRSVYPFERAEKQFRAEDLRRLRRIVADLQRGAEELPQFMWLILLSAQEGWPDGPLKVPNTLFTLAAMLRQCVPIADGFNHVTAYDRLPRLVTEVRELTGKPYFAELATLVGAAYGRPSFCSDELKMIDLRARKKKSNAGTRKLSEHGYSQKGNIF